MIELLAVMAVVALLASVTIPAVSSFRGAGVFERTASDIPDLLSQARAYAMGKNTYVYVGFQEVDGVAPTSADGVGRVAVAVVASKDGSRPYANTPAPLAGNVTPISKLHYFDNVHLANAADLSNGSTMTGRPSAAIDLAGSTAKTTFQWPVAATAKHNFSKVIEFDPQGVPRVQKSTTYDSSVKNCIEIALVPTVGNAVASTANQAAIQIDGVTGAIRLFRP